MTAETLDEALRLQNASAYGLTAGIHSLDAVEVATWLDTVDAGNLYVNRGITGAVVRRQPFGGWKRSTVGAGTKAGGPNYLMSLGSWSAEPSELGTDLRLDDLSRPVASMIKNAQSGINFDEFDVVRHGAESDERAWKAEFGQARDVSDLQVERNIFRYLPVAVTIRLAEGAPLGHLVRLIAAATRAGSTISISSALPLPTTLVTQFASDASPVAVTELVIESDAAFLDRVSAGDVSATRIRLVGGNASALSAAVAGDPDVAIYAGEVTTAGRIELLPFLHEQSISITAHRFGNPDQAMATLPV